MPADMTRLRAMAADGRKKMEDKAPQMKTNYEDAKSGMKETYEKTPFGNKMKKHYKAAIDAATFKVDATKWEEKWVNRASQD